MFSIVVRSNALALFVHCGIYGCLSYYVHVCTVYIYIASFSASPTAVYVRSTYHTYVLKARVYTYKRGSCSSELAHGVRAYLLLGLCVGIHTQFVGIHGVRAYGV